MTISPEEVQIKECLSLNPSFQSRVARLIHAMTLVRIGDIPPLYSGLHQISASEVTINFLLFQCHLENYLLL